MRKSKGETRSWDQIREHYEIERSLASQLRNSSKEERRTLYSRVYDELYRRVPHHPRNTERDSPDKSTTRVAREYALLRRFLLPTSIFLEIGPGDCAVALEVAKHVAFVYAVDVSEYITKGIVFPVNFQLVMSDGSSIPVPAGSVHLAYSNQVMEHLHPDDALEQLRNVFQGLAPGGRYICVTPNRLCGPMDISRYFDSVPTGFHLKEYSIGELRRLFQAAGFRSVRQYAALRGVQVEVPTFPYLALEALLNPLPFELRRRIAALRVVRRLLNVRIVGLK